MSILDPPDLRDYQKLTGRHPERPILIAPMIRQGDLVMITGQSGCGKSTFACDIIASLVCPPVQFAHSDEMLQMMANQKILDDMGMGTQAGIAYLNEEERFDATTDLIEGYDEALAGLFKVNRYTWNRRSCVILDAENTAADWRTTMAQTLSARGIRLGSGTWDFITGFDGDSLGYIHWRGSDSMCDFNDYKEFQAWVKTDLLKELIALRCGAIFMDSTHAFWNRDLNSPEWAEQGLNFLRRQLMANGITFFTLTHTSRDFKDKLPGNRFRPLGSSRQEANVDTLIGIDRKIKDKTLVVYLVKNRSAKWLTRGTHATVKLSPTYGGYQRIIGPSPWPMEDPGAITVMPTKGERNLLAKLPDGDFQLKDLDGNTTRNKKYLAGLVEIYLLDHDDGTYTLTGAGTKLRDTLKEDE